MSSFRLSHKIIPNILNKRNRESARNVCEREEMRKNREKERERAFMTEV